MLERLDFQNQFVRDDHVDAVGVRYLTPEVTERQYCLTVHRNTGMREFRVQQLLVRMFEQSWSEFLVHVDRPPDDKSGQPIEFHMKTPSILAGDASNPKP